VCTSDKKGKKLDSKGDGSISLVRHDTRVECVELESNDKSFISMK